MKHAVFAFAAIMAVSLAPLSVNAEENMSDTQAQTPMQPPVAEPRPYSYERHGITVQDPYFWLKDQSYPKVDDKDVLDYLKQENAYFEDRMNAHQPLLDTLFTEMKARIKEDDSSVPQKDGDWLYWVEYDTGAQYKKWYRKPVAGGDKVLILDETALAKDAEYFRLGDFSVSPDGRMLAYSSDTNGSERFDARVKNLETGELLDDIIPGTLSSLVWSSDSGSLVYGLANENWRTDNARLHVVGTPFDDDVELYHEDDDGFRVNVGLTSSEKYIVIAAGDNETSEVRLVDAANPAGEQMVVRPRKKGVEYAVDEHDGTLFIHTNDDHLNFRLATASMDAPGAWETLIPGSDLFYMTDVEVYKDFYVVEGRENGLDQVQVRYYDNPERVERIAFPEASFSAGLSDNPEYDTQKLRLSYESMVTPDTVYDYYVGSKKLETLKIQEIPSGYDAGAYVTERVTIRARDGAMVPVSMVYKKGTKRDGTAPLHLYAYGAYGHAIPPNFSSTRLSLVDRGFIYAIAHIRGGDDLGRQWYLDGKLKKRTNTFNDFVDVARGLAEKKYTSLGRITASGGSAGGELMGAIVNSDPEIWGAVAAHVPFVDVLNTMLDESLPLTPGEWPEWGNPVTDKAAFELLQSYSPYDNVKAHDYPPMLITGGLNDPRVTYWEPAKWAAKLRATKTDDNVLLLKTNMGAGHGGKSGRFDSLHELAEEFAFVLWQMDMAEE